jgi:hypothetical protein
MNVIKFIDTLDDKSPSNVRSELYKHGILSTYENHDDESKSGTQPTRMVFYTSKNQRFVRESKMPELLSECNGLIIDMETLKPVVIPTYSLMHNIDSVAINANLANNLYDVYPAQDGTIINLYYWEPMKSWRISTGRSMDATDSNWGNTTYVDILEELLFVNKGNLETFYEHLDTTKCYTFGFKHPSMHMFHEGTNGPVYKLWFIQSVELDTGVVSNEVNDTALNELMSQYKISKQFPIDIPVSDGATMSLAHFNYNIKTALKEFLKSGKVCYGFILRSRYPSRTGGNNTILLESTLMQKIRHLWYHSNYNEIAKQFDYDREKFTIIYSYLNINTHTSFIQLFPQYNEHYTQLSKITTTLVKGVAAYTASLETGATINNVDGVIKHIYESIDKLYALHSSDKNIIKMISSYVLDTNFVDVYYKRFQWDNTAPSLN